MTPPRSARAGRRAAPGTPIALRVRGAVATLDATDRQTLFDRSTSTDDAARARTAAIIDDVRRRGDAALIDLARELDGVELERLEIPAVERRRALDAIDPSLRSALERARDNIATAHRALLPRATEIETEPGVRLGRRPDPLGRVGVYAPGGRAAYPSSLLMGAIPARVAGVGEVIVCSPPQDDGRPSPVVLAAAELAGADRVFAIGGAGAIAAMALGTRSVPRVDRIVGPGNAYVAEAKLQLVGAVAIDAPAGPSELLLIADGTPDDAMIAIELLAQAEHDPRAAVVAVCIDRDMRRLETAVAGTLRSMERRAIAAESLTFAGALLSADSLDEALRFAADYAPEHLLLAVADPGRALPLVRNAGTVFLGATSSVAFGDYLTGANHVLPTGGLARCYSGLSTADFVRWTTWQSVDPSAARRLGGPAASIADAERLFGHASAARAAGGWA